MHFKINLVWFLYQLGRFRTYMYIKNQQLTQDKNKEVLFLKEGMSWLRSKSVILKGQCHEIFDHFFFHESNPSGPLINRLKCS